MLNVRPMLLNRIPSLAILLISSTNAETTPPPIPARAAESTVLTIATILQPLPPAALNNKQTITITVTRTLHPTSSPALRSLNLTEPGTYTNYVYIVLFVIFLLANACLVSYVIWYVFDKFRWKWIHGVRYEQELRAARMEVGESAAWSDAGSVERAMHRAGVRERMGVWWRSDRGSLVRSGGSRAVRFSGFEQGSGRSRGSLGRRSFEEV